MGCDAQNVSYTCPLSLILLVVFSRIWGDGHPCLHFSSCISTCGRHPFQVIFWQIAASGRQDFLQIATSCFGQLCLLRVEGGWTFKIKVSGFFWISIWTSNPFRHCGFVFTADTFCTEIWLCIPVPLLAYRSMCSRSADFAYRNKWSSLPELLANLSKWDESSAKRKQSVTKCR